MLVANGNRYSRPLKRKMKSPGKRPRFNERASLGINMPTINTAKNTASSQRNIGIAGTVESRI